MLGFTDPLIEELRSEYDFGMGENVIPNPYTEGDGSNYLAVQFQTSDVYDGTDSVAGWHQVANGGYIANSSYDATMKITYCE